MASNLSRRMLLKYTRNALYAFPFGSVLASSLWKTAYAGSADNAFQPYFWRNVVTGGGGGFVVDVIFSHKEKDLIYARTDIGGAYRWNPSTGTWTQLLGWVTTAEWKWAG